MFSTDSCDKTVIHSWWHHFWGVLEISDPGNRSFPCPDPFLLPLSALSSQQGEWLLTNRSCHQDFWLPAGPQQCSKSVRGWNHEPNTFPPLNCFHTLAKHTENHQWLVFNHWIHIALKQHKYFHVPQKQSSISSAMVWIYPEMPIMKLSPHCRNIKRWTSNKKDLGRTFFAFYPFFHEDITSSSFGTSARNPLGNGAALTRHQTNHLYQLWWNKCMLIIHNHSMVRYYCSTNELID